MILDLLSDTNAIKQLSQEKPQVVIVGSGAGGASVGYRLAAQGKDVVILEMGPKVGLEDFTALPSQMYQKLYVNAGLTGTIGNGVIALPFSSGFGGTTTINSGTCFRPPEKVMDDWRRSFGLKEVDTQALYAYCEQIETLLGIQPTHEGISGKNNVLFAKGANELGLKGNYIKRNAPACKGCGICCFGCPSGAKMSMERSFLPFASDHNAHIYTHAKLENIHINGSRVDEIQISVSGKDASFSINIKVENLVLSGGAIFTPLLLKRQKNKGLSKNKMLGKNLRIHPATKVLADFEEATFPARGVPQAYYVDEYQDRGIMLEGASLPPDVGSVAVPYFGKKHAELMKRYNHLASFGIMVSDTSHGVVYLRGKREFVLWYWLNRFDLDRFKFGLEEATRIYLAAGAKRIFLPTFPTVEIKGEEDLKAFKQAKLFARHLELAAFHPMGTCRMGVNPSSSVVDVNLKFHGLENLFIGDASIFPGSLGVNPQVSIMAFGYRLADYLRDCL